MSGRTSLGTRPLECVYAYVYVYVCKCLLCIKPFKNNVRPNNFMHQTLECVCVYVYVYVYRPAHACHGASGCEGWLMLPPPLPLPLGPKTSLKTTRPLRTCSSWSPGGRENGYTCM